MQAAGFISLHVMSRRGIVITKLRDKAVAHDIAKKKFNSAHAIGRDVRSLIRYNAYLEASLYSL